MALLTQQQTDLVDITDLPGGLSLLTFAWESRRHAPEARYLLTTQVADTIADCQATGAPVVSALADHPAPMWQVLNRAEGAPDVLHREVYEAVRDQSWRASGGLPPAFLQPTEAGTTVALGDLYAYDHHEGTLLAATTGRPVTRPLLVEASSADFDLPVLAHLLTSRPEVLALAYRPGWGAEDTAGDSTPAHLLVVLRPDQNLYDAILATGRPMDHLLFAPATWAASNGVPADPLGVQAAAWKTATGYGLPTTRDDSDYPAYDTYHSDLAATLPSASDLWYGL